MIFLFVITNLEIDFNKTIIPVISYLKITPNRILSMLITKLISLKTCQSGSLLVKQHNCLKLMTTGQLTKLQKS